MRSPSIWFRTPKPVRIRHLGDQDRGRDKGILRKHGGNEGQGSVCGGKWISFRREKIDQTYNLNERKNGSKFKRLVKEPNLQKVE